MTKIDPSTSDDKVRFPSLTSLRATHSELLKHFRADGLTSEVIAEIETFISRGKATGALLDIENDRWAAQVQLDYWATQLYKPGQESPDATLDNFDPQLAPEIDDSLCPYVGLDSFHESNQSVFFGRGRLISELSAKLNASRFLAVLGSSGSGKSSLVRAGLIPSLKKGGLSGSENWIYFEPIVPGSAPLNNLARLIVPEDSDKGTIESVVKRLREEPGYLVQFLSEQFDESVVLIIDQFEEVFSLCTDETARNSFVDSLLELSQETGSNHRVIITMRTDFESNVMRMPKLQATFEENEFRVTQFSASELREIIEAPAALIGLKFAEGVVDALLNDVLGEPTALPLLQFTLLKLWENRERNRVTWETYQRLGGGRETLRRSADKFYKGLILEEQITMRRILLKMVRPGEGLEVTSNRIQRSVLYQKAEASDRIDRVLDKLIKERLVRISEGDNAADEQIEIAHEALIRNWPRLVEWLDEERVVLRQRQRLTSAASEWQRLNRATSALWRRELLEEARQYDDLSDLESQFVNASNRYQEWVRRAWIIGLSSLIGILIIASASFYQQSKEATELAEKQTILAEEQTILAQEQEELAKLNEYLLQEQTKLTIAIRLTSQAQLLIRTESSKQLTAVLLAIQSWNIYPSVENNINAVQFLKDNTAAKSTLLISHDGPVNSIAISPDGLYMVTVSDDTTAVIWDTSKERPIATLRHQGPVNAVSFSDDGRYIVTGSDDHSVRVWLTETGRPVSRMNHDGPVLSIAFRPGGDYSPLAIDTAGNYFVVSGSSDGTARVWDALTGDEISHMTHFDRVQTVDFSPDGRYVISGSSDGTARVWDALTGDEISRVTHNNRVRSVAFSPDGIYAISGSDDGKVRVWDVVTGEEIATMDHDAPVRSFAISSDGGYMVSAGDCEETVTTVEDDETGIPSELKICIQATARVWDVFTGTEISQIIHDDAVNSVAFSADGQYVISGSADKTARLWQVSTGKEIARMTHDEEVLSVALDSTRQLFFSGDSGGNVYFWEPIPVNEIARTTHDERVYSAVFSPDGQYIASAGCDTRDDFGTCTEGIVYVQEALTGNFVSKVTHESYVNMVTFSPDGKYVVSGGCKERNEEGTCIVGVAIISNPNTGEIIREFHHAPPKDSSDSKDYFVYALAFSSDGKYLLTGGLDHTARVWDVNTWEEIARMTHDDSVYAVAFSERGSFALSGSSDGTARVWNTFTGELISLMEHADAATVYAVAFSEDSRFAVSGSVDKSVQVWNVRTGEPVSRMEHNDVVISVAFSPVGYYVASGGYDRTARVWDATTGEEIARMTHDDTVRSVSFSPDGKFVVSASYDGTARVWDAFTGEEVARITHDAFVYSAVFSSDGKHIVSASRDATARAWVWQTEDYIDSVCKNLPRNFTSDEWKKYFDDDEYQKTCPKLPLHKTFIADTALHIVSDLDRTSPVETAIAEVTKLLKSNSNSDNDIDIQAKEITAEAVEKRLSTTSSQGLDTETIYFYIRLLEEAKDFGLDIEVDHDFHLRIAQGLLDEDDLDRIQTAITNADKVLEFTSNDNSSFDAKAIVKEAIETQLAEIANLTLDSKNITRYTKLLEEANEYGLEVEADPAYLSRVARDSLADQDDPNRIQTAITKVGEILVFTPDSAPIERATEIVGESIGSIIRSSNFRTGDLDYYLDFLDDAETLGIEVDTVLRANDFNQICWFGSIRGYAQSVLPYCEKAVALASGVSATASYRDSRGLALALTGDFEGAITDFQYYVDNSINTSLAEKRAQWILDLEQGIDPFTPEVLDDLLYE